MSTHSSQLPWPIPKRLVATCRMEPERQEWLGRVPDALRELEARWELRLGAPIDTDEVSCAWVAPVMRADGSPGVLKLGMPHMEAEHEIEGLQFWDADPTVRLYDSDKALNAILMERCVPGTVLRTLPETEQDVVIARLLRRLWRTPPEPHPFRPLAQMVKRWGDEAEADEDAWRDPGLLREGLRLFDELPRTATRQVLLATDLHAGNVLRAEREPWLVIDPKPFVGDPAYDATQHLLNCRERLRSKPDDTIQRFADLLKINSERVRFWLFARLAAESGEEWRDDPGETPLARLVAP